MVADKEDQLDDEALGNEESEENSEEEEAGKKFSKKKILLFVVMPLIVLLATGAGLYFTGILGGAPVEEEIVVEEEPLDTVSTGIYYDIPDIIVNLNTTGRKPRFLKISVSLELQTQADQARVEQILPRVLDHFQTYLRELRESDLRGSAGIYRLRLELLARVNAALYPEKVRDVLFREILIQ